MKDCLNSYQTLSAMVHAFFEAFANGVVDSYKADIRNSKQLKQVMLHHYEDISGCYANVMFPILSVLNNKDAQAVEKKINAGQNKEDEPMAFVFKIACNTPELYRAMVEEYRRNFAQLLQGRIFTVQEHFEQYIQGEGRTVTNEEQTIRLMVRTVIRAYVEGMRISKTGKRSLHQATILRLLITAAAILINDEAPNLQRAAAIDDVYEYFLFACRTKERCNVVFSEMDNEMKLQVATTGIISTDDRAN